jgi:apolipoprotein N-acyltransferase
MLVVFCATIGSTGPRPQPVKHNATAAVAAAIRRKRCDSISNTPATGAKQRQRRRDFAEAPLALRVLVIVGSPLLLTLAFPRIGFGSIALVALAPSFWLWSRASWKTAILDGWIAGTIFFFVLFHWMTNALGDYIGAWKILAGVLLALLEGSAFAVTAVVTSLVCRGGIRAITVFALPAVWLLVESARTRGAFGVPFGELGLTAVHMPWLLPLAAYVGVYGLTAIVALCNGALLGIAAGSRSAKVAGAAVFAFLIVVTGVGDAARSHVAIPAPTLEVAIAQGNISQREKWSPQIFQHTLAVYSDLTRTAATQNARIVVWPETAITSYPLQEPDLLGYLERLAAANRVWLFAGTLDKPGSHALHNSVIAISPAAAYAARYDKHILVPFAEYLPLDQYLRGLPLFDEASPFVPGPGPTLLRADGFRFGVLVCYESAFGPYAREIANAGADALVVVTDDAWFDGTSGPWQHADMSVMDAVQTGRWVVRGADTGISDIIDPKGTVVAQLALDQRGIVRAAIGPPIDAPYVRIGNWWLLLAALAVLLAGFLPGRSGALGWRSRRGRW